MINKVLSVVVVLAGCTAGEDATDETSEAADELTQAVENGCTAAKLVTPKATTVGVAGDPLPLQATTTCPVGAQIEVQFRVRMFPSTTWINLPGTASTTSWTPPSGGTWYVLAAVRTVGSTKWVHSAQIRFNVTGNRLPVAQADAATLQKNGALALDVTANDSDPDGDPLSVSFVAPAHGTATISDQTISYTPAFDYVGSDAIDYTIDDGRGGTASARLSITVAAPASACAVSVSPTTSSTPQNTPARLTASATCDGPAIEYQWYRTVAIDSFEVVRPWSAIATYDAPTPEVGALSVFALARTVTAQGQSAAATINVVAPTTKCTAVKLNTPVSSTVGTSGVPLPLVATPTCPPDTTIETQFRVRKYPSLAWINLPGTSATSSWAPPTAGLWYVLAAARVGSTPWVHSVQVRFNVGEGNRAPIANDDAALTSEDTAVTIDLAANDSDPDGDSLAFAITSSPAHGTLDLSSPASPVYTPAANYFGADGFTYTVTDGHGGSDTATVSISIGSVDDPPVAANDSLVTYEDVLGSVDVLANDVDPDGALAILEVTNGAHGTVAFQGAIVTYSPTANFHGADAFTVTISDGVSSATSTVFVTVNSVADQPVARDDASTVAEDGSVSIDVLANDSDDDGDSLGIIAAGPASHGVVWFGGDRVYYAPEPDFHGTDSFTYNVFDGGEPSTATVLVTVTPINDAPTTQPDVATVAEDGELTIDVLANDADVDNDSLTIVNHGGATSGAMSIVDGMLVYTPTANFHGTDASFYQISDGISEPVSGWVTITVTPVNDAPVASNLSTVIGSMKNLTLVATDLESDPLTFAIVQGPAHGTLSNASGKRITYTREAGYTGPDSFTFTANDGAADSNVATASITVIEPTIGASIDAGIYHSCSVRTDATLWCWGYNGHGQLGSGTWDQPQTPIQVGTEAVWSTVATGGYHTCATKLDGTLWCWGADWEGQLGNGEQSDSPTPGQVAGTDWSTVSGGHTHTCATKVDGTLWCWGHNSEGELGNGDTQVSQLPVAVSGSEWATVATGFHHTCATKTDDTLWCWGGNWIGQSGLDSSVQMTPTPTQVGEETWTRVEANGDHTCALRSDDSLWCWGHNGHGELGDGTGSSSYVPVRVAADEGATWATLGLGPYHSCATRSDDSLWCWGRDYQGTLGDGLEVQQNAPIRVGTQSAWSSVAGGHDHTCGVNDGQLLCWGSNGQNQLGIAWSNIERSPKVVSIGATQDIAAGDNHACAIRADGSLWCWGTNGNGQLGTNASGDVHPPAPVDASSWTSVTAGMYHSCAIKADSSLWCWGYSGHGALGTSGGNSQLPNQVDPGSTWQQVAGDGRHTCAIKSDDTLWCWGSNDWGQLGNGNNEVQYLPAQVGMETTWASVSTAEHHTCAIRDDQSLWCWGYNGWGNLGDGTNNSTTVPIQVTGTWTSVSLGLHHTCATQTDDTLWCWGYGGHGQLGDGTSAGSTTPLRVGSDADWVDTKAGGLHSCARKTDDSMWCFGHNDEGQLGLGGRDRQLSPVKLLGTWQTAELGRHFSCAIRMDQSLACWGYNNQGQTAQPSPYGAHLPSPVADFPSGLVAHYRGEYNSNDAVGSRHGTLSGGASYAAGVRDSAFTFDGTGTFTAPSAGLPAGGDARTVMAWVRVDAAVATEAFFVGYGSFAANAAFSLGAKTDMTAAFSSGTSSTSAGLLALSHWHHVAVTSTGTAVTLFVDGVETATGTHALATVDNESLLFGMLDSDHRLQGAIDEVRIYDRALTAAQIELLHSIDD